MATLPQLTEEDIQQIDSALRELLKQTDAVTALVADKGGFLITHQGDGRQFDLTTIAALASGAYMANQTIANLVHETNFSSVYQQGDNFSIFAVSIDDQSILIVIFKAGGSVGVVKYFSVYTIETIAKQLKVAQLRDPEGGFDLSVLNIANSESIFRKKEV
jgi:predicted regulator of Ras-like GTPase activity (Roadblock/LC7/MglB family)